MEFRRVLFVSFRSRLDVVRISLFTGTITKPRTAVASGTTSTLRIFATHTCWRWGAWPPVGKVHATTWGMGTVSPFWQVSRWPVPTLGIRFRWAWRAVAQAIPPTWWRRPVAAAGRRGGERGG